MLRHRFVALAVIVSLLSSTPAFAQTEIFGGKVSGALLGVDASSYASFPVAISSIGSATQTLIVSTLQTVSATMVVPQNITVMFVSAGQLSIQTGVTVTINGPIIAPRRQIFIYNGTGVISLGHSSNNNQTVVYPEWWGARNDGFTDNNASSTGIFQSAINAFTGAGVIDFNEGAYFFSTGLTITREIELRGQSRRGTGLYFNGAGGTAIYCNLSADSFYIHDIGLDNQNATPGAIGIDMDCERATVARVTIIPTKGFTTAALRSGNGGGVFNHVLDNVTVSGKSIGQSNAIGYHAVAGNNLNVRDSHFSGNNVGVRLGAGANTVDGANIRGTTFEIFNGVTGPGIANGIGIDVVNAQGFSIYGNKLEPNASALLPIQLATCDGGLIAGNFLIGDGVTATGIAAISAACKGVAIMGNSLFNFTAQGISLTNGAQVDVLTNYLGTATPVTMLSDRDITGHQLGAPNYVLQPGQGFSGFAVNYNPILNKASAGVHSDVATMFLQPTTITGGAATITNNTTLKLGNAPTGGTTRNYSLWVSAGQATFDGATQVNAGLGIGANPVNSNTITFASILFANLGTSLTTNGQIGYCSNCDPSSAVDSTCTSAGAQTGNLAMRINGIFKCAF